VKAELLPLSSLSADDIRRWQELSDTASEPNPFFEPAYVLAAQEALAEPDVSLLVARGGGEAGWSLCIPVVKRWRWRRAPVPGLVAWRHIYSYLGTPLMAAGSERRSADALLDWLRPPACSSFLGVDLLHRDGPVYAALAAAAEAHERGLVAYEEIERASMEAHDGVGSLAINRKHQREAARMRRRLADELGTPVATRDRAGEPEAVEAFLALEASGWKGQEGTAIATIGHGDFLREVCSAFHRVGRLQLISFETEGRAIAMGCSLRGGDTLFLFKIAFDEELAQYSPGIQLQVDNLELFNEDESLQLMDSCALPGNAMINRLWADRRRLSAVAIPAGGVRGQAVAAAVRALASVRNARNTRESATES
jgi:CelD/BcsL family acetyltransferase involved in cellulose biosynthesis